MWRAGSRIQEIFLQPALGAAEVMVGIYMLAFALPLFRLEVLVQSGTYAQMARLAPGWVWGLVLASVGLWRIGAAVSGWYRNRIAATAAGIFCWTLLFLTFLHVQKWHPGVTVFASWVFMDAWLLMRIGNRP